MTNNTAKTTHTQGFTLIELSIVLVIIGLIAGGILVGQDMIKGAEIRSTVKQVEQINAAMNTFRDKYRFLPGDITSTAAAQFGFAARTGAVGRGDGNSYIEGGAAAATALNSETVLVWRDLNLVGLLDGSFTVGADAAAAPANPDAVKTFLPEAKLGRGNVITVYSATGNNFYQIGGIESASATPGLPVLRPSMTPQEAFNLDQKLDDGRPTTGSSRAMDSLAASALNLPAALGAAGTTGVCVVTGTLVYNTSTEASANTPACALRVRTN
ncbi:MAG: prepilin-type N-terminal cleavage/methylation domain-containing protein [Rickettsiales bacterium]|nr:prepilin-type N-terminal cleavage/methylation domain-containing protein [Rickettsiales bacterium]